MMIFYFLMSVGVMLLLATAILVVPVIPAMRTGRRWIAPSSRRSNSVRNLETIQFAIGLSVLAVMWVFGSHFTWPPEAMAEAVDTIRFTNKPVFVTGAILGVVALFVTWRFSTVVGMMGMILIGGTALMAFNMKIRSDRQDAFERKHPSTIVAGSNANPAAETPNTLIRFELIDPRVGAELWVNGVSLGKTPVEITARELLGKVAVWTRESPELQEVYPPSPESQWTDARGKVFRLWGWCPLHFPPDMERSTNLYFKVELNDVVGWSTMGHRTHLKPGTPEEMILVKLDTVFPQWDHELETLLDRARLNNYETDEAWQNAFQSFGEFGLKLIEQCSAAEPLISRLKGDNPKLAAMLRDVTDSASAWQLLMKIEDEARQTRSYDSKSANGLAVDQIVPMLDPVQLVEHARQLLRTTENPDPPGVQYDQEGGFGFATWDEAGINSSGEKSALFPIAQAVWRLDQSLDALPSQTSTDRTAQSMFLESTMGGPKVYNGMAEAIDPSADNLVERQLTPELLRMCYGNENRLQYLDVLGGSVYESFLLRNDWHTQATDPFNGVRIGDHSQVYVNKWYSRLMRLRTPLGAKFRRQQQSNLLEIARKGMTRFSLSSDLFSGVFLSLLFSDREFSDEQPSLAMQFWQDVKAATADQSVHQSHQIRWEYLGRLWPESTPAMFVDVLQDAVQKHADYVHLLELPNTMPLADQYQVLMAVIQDQQQTVATIPRVPGDDTNYMTPRQKHLRVISTLRELLYHLPCEQAAAQWLADMKAEPDHSWHKNIANFLKYDTTHEDLIRLIATGDHVKLQRDMLPAIQNHPILSRVQLLEGLLKSPDESVRQEAAAVKAYLDNLRTQRLPHRAELRK